MCEPHTLYLAQPLTRFGPSLVVYTVWWEALICVRWDETAGDREQNTLVYSTHVTVNRCYMQLQGLLTVLEHLDNNAWY